MKLYADGFGVWCVVPFYVPDGVFCDHQTVAFVPHILTPQPIVEGGPHVVAELSQAGLVLGVGDGDEHVNVSGVDVRPVQRTDIDFDAVEVEALVLAWIDDPLPATFRDSFGPAFL